MKQLKKSNNLLRRSELVESSRFQYGRCAPNLKSLNDTSIVRPFFVTNF